MGCFTAPSGTVRKVGKGGVRGGLQGHGLEPSGDPWYVGSLPPQEASVFGEQPLSQTPVPGYSEPGPGALCEGFLWAPRAGPGMLLAEFPWAPQT